MQFKKYKQMKLELIPIICYSVVCISKLVSETYIYSKVICFNLCIYGLPIPERSEFIYTSGYTLFILYALQPPLHYSNPKGGSVSLEGDPIIRISIIATET